MNGTAIFPEIIENAFKNKEINELIIWTILKSYDNLTNADGKLEYSKIKDILKKYSQSSIYRHLSNNSFWNKNQKDIYLFGIKTICKKYNIERLSKGYFVPIDYFYQCSLKRQKAFLFSMVISKTNNPQSYINIAERCGICRRTAIEYINICPNINKIKNYCLVSNYQSIGKLNQTISGQLPKDNHIIKDDSGIYLVKQMPNSYQTELWDRVSPKALNRKIRSSSLLHSSRTRIYGRAETADTKYIFKGMSNIGSYLEDWTPTKERQNVNMWMKNENMQTM